MRRIETYLSLNDDLHHLYELIDSDPPFVTVKRELYGYHQVKFLTPFENACWTILSQRNSLAIAKQMKRSIIEAFSAAVEFEGREYWPFPGAKEVVRASVEDLTGLLRNSRRAEYIRGAAVAFSEVDEAFLREGAYDEVSRWLRSHPRRGRLVGRVHHDPQPGAHGAHPLR